MHRVVIRIFALAFGLSILASAPALARCERSHIPWRYGQSVSSVWTTDGAVCTDVPNEHQYIAAIQITQRPKHGVLGKAGLFARLQAGSWFQRYRYAGLRVRVEQLVARRCRPDRQRQHYRDRPVSEHFEA